MESLKILVVVCLPKRLADIKSARVKINTAQGIKGKSCNAVSAVTSVVNACRERETKYPL